MMRNRFDMQLEELNHELTEMGALCERIIAIAVSALSERDSELLEKISPIDAEIDQKERDIETMCLKLLLRQQPVARDLRQISAALKMITDMERIGDQAADIAEIVSFVGEDTKEKYEKLFQMARATIKMVRDSVDAYVSKDVEKAREVILYDDVVDGYFDDIKKNLIGLILAKPEEGERAMDYLMIAKYFERIGDHATNIAEWVEFSITGIHKGAVEL